MLSKYKKIFFQQGRNPRQCSGLSLRQHSGLAFIEAIVALGVLLTAIISGLTLATFNLNTSVGSEGRLKAANLAREAIEVIRQIRDSNWLAGDAWNTAILQNPNNYRLTVNFNPLTNSWSTTDQTSAIAACASPCQLYFNATNGVYSHILSGQLTTYKRLVTLNEICWQAGVAGETILALGQRCSGSNQLIGYQLTVEITWRDNNRDHLMTVMDRIYDWR